MRVRRLIIVLALAGFGCSKWLPSGAPSEAGAPVTGAIEGGTGHALTPLWSDRELHVAELPTARVRFDADDLSYEIRFKDFPPGTIFVVGGRAISTAGDHTERIDAAEVISRMSPVSALDDKAPLDPHTDFELRVPGYDPLKAAAPPCRVSREISSLMANAVDHSVLFPREAATDPPIAIHSILFIPNSSIGDTVFGPAATMRDVDWVAVAEPRPGRKGGTCPIPAEGGGPPKIAKLALIDEEVVIVERKTSRVINRKTFPAVTECSTFASDGTTENSPDPAAIKRWLRDERTKP
jgi:hypothetical protein